LSYALWRSTFAGDPSIVGRSIRLGGEPYVVTGVMPRNFRVFGFTSDLWVPLPRDHSASYWSSPSTLAFGRLRPGVTAEAASAELTAIAVRVQHQFYLALDWATGARVVDLRENMVGSLRPTILLLTGAVVLLLGLATANVTVLLLLRAAERREEVSVRVALGASTGRIAALVLGESLTIGLVGGLLGVALSALGIRLLLLVLPPNLPRREEIVLDGRVLLAAGTLTLIVTVLTSLAPAWQSRAAGSSGRLRQSRTVSSPGQRQRGLLVAVEVALALVLGIGATLMGRTLFALNHVDPGLETDHLLTMKMEPSFDNDDQLRAYWSVALARVRSIPGVRAAATLLHLPLSGRAWSAPITIEGRPLAPDQVPPQAHWQAVSTDYFRTAGVRVLRGRPFDDRDGPRVPRVIAINSALADRVFSGVNPIGQRIRAGNATEDSLATIVAVVASVRHDSLAGPPGPEVYVPFTQRTVGATALLVRTNVPPLSIAASIRDELWAINRDVPISDIRTMDDLFAASLARQRMVLVMFALFAGIGLVLSAVGTYGVVAFAAAQRTQEIGIRMALGATPRAMVRFVMNQALGFASLGAAAGLLLALAMSRVMRGMLYGVPPTDWTSFTAASLALTAVVVAATLIPARRAASVNPIVALTDRLSTGTD
jgi:predicted permease